MTICGQGLWFIQFHHLQIIWKHCHEFFISKCFRFDKMFHLPFKAALWKVYKSKFNFFKRKLKCHKEFIFKFLNEKKFFAHASEAHLSLYLNSFQSLKRDEFLKVLKRRKAKFWSSLLWTTILNDLINVQNIAEEEKWSKRWSKEHSFWY